MGLNIFIYNNLGEPVRHAKWNNSNGKKQMLHDFSIV